MKTAMILAAGRGERLRPLTDQYPKALCKVNNTPLIEYHVRNLADAGFEHLVINHAHLGGQIRHYLGTGKRWGVTISYSPEPPGGLETGGGIVNALRLIGTEPFLTVNADIYIEYDFKKFHIPEDTWLHLILVEKPDYALTGDFGLAAPHHLNNNKEFTCAGIAGYRPEIFKPHRLGRFSVVPIWRDLVSHNKGSGELYTGRWLDIGTPERLILANKRNRITTQSNQA